MSVTAWEDDNSLFHARRRALVAGRGVKPDRLAVLLVDRPGEATALKHALAGQPIELEIAGDPAAGLFLLGRTCPDIVVVGPTAGLWVPRTLTQSLISAFTAGRPRRPPSRGSQHDRPLWPSDSST